MKSMAPLGLAIAALLIALAAWAGFDLESITGPGESPPAATVPADKPKPPRAEKQDRPARQPPAIPPGAFDYYVLALSWSPTYCQTEATDRDKLQCKGERPFAFIVHGLWPQNENGYPEDCPTDTPRVPDALVDDLLDIMPSRGLIGHEWRAHGACSGLSQEDYFAAVRQAYEAVAIPARFESIETALSLPPQQILREFMTANERAATPKSMVVTCGGGTHLDEVRICLTKEMRFRDCGRQTQRATCRRETVIMPPLRASAP